LDDPGQGMRKGSLRFVLHGRRLSGRFTLARLSRRDPRKQDAWFLIKGHDEAAREGVDATALEQMIPLPPADQERETTTQGSDTPPAAGAIRGTPPETQAPQLCSIAEEPPEGEDWVSEIKLDGYRLIVSVDQGNGPSADPQRA
jgi:bifunctional non-homologous end joining protein LigD